MQHLPPAEGQELASQGGRGPTRFFDLLNISVEKIVRFKNPQAEITVPDNGRQQVVEVVGNATRQLSDRFQLLRLPELLLAFPERLFGLDERSRPEDEAAAPPVEDVG